MPLTAPTLACARTARRVRRTIVISASRKYTRWCTPESRNAASPTPPRGASPSCPTPPPIASPRPKRASEARFRGGFWGRTCTPGGRTHLRCPTPSCTAKARGNDARESAPPIRKAQLRTSSPQAASTAPCDDAPQPPPPVGGSRSFRANARNTLCPSRHDTRSGRSACRTGIAGIPFSAHPLGHALRNDSLARQRPRIFPARRIPR